MRIIKTLVAFGLMIVLSFSTVWASSDAYDADESKEEYIEYDYITKQTKSFTLDDVNESVEYPIIPAHVVCPEDETRTIVNGDTPSLTQVNANNSPYSMVTYLYLGRDNDGDGICEKWVGGTGFMVYSNIMLTAGHCMYNSANGNVEQMRIYIKQNSSSQNSTYYYPASWILPSQYTSNPNKNYDWCIVKTQSSIGNQTGWLGYGVATSSKTVTVSGYPDQSGYRYYQYKNGPKTMIIQSTFRCKYTCNTLVGDSGAPIYDSNGIAWGIHTKNEDSSYNSGCLITSNIYNLIENYKTS